MKYFYSGSRNGFYPDSLISVYEANGTLPDDLVEIDTETYERCMGAPGQGATIRPDENGRPVVVPLPGPTPDERQAANAAERDRLLAIAAIRIAPLEDAAEIGEITAAEQQALNEWKAYRVAVNRVDVSAEVVEWPPVPGDQ